MKRMQESKMVRPIFIGRWTPKVLFSLKERPYRHGQLRRHIGIVSQHILTRTLRNLESTGLITRRVTRSKAIAVEYSLTQLGGHSSLHLELCAAGRNDTEGTSVLTCAFQQRTRRDERTKRKKDRFMKNRNFTITFSVDQSPEEVFDAINNVRGWRSEEIDGSTDTLSAEFTFPSKDLHRSTQKIIELVPGRNPMACFGQPH